MKKEFKEVKIKVVTYKDIFYTWAVLKPETDLMVENAKDLDGKDIPLEQLIENNVFKILSDLNIELNIRNFIHCLPDNKIINTKEIKEVVVQYF